MFGIRIVFRQLIDLLLKDVGKSVWNFSSVRKGSTMLDVCCGSGEQAIYFARKGAIVTGIDLDPIIIQEANRKKKKLNLNMAYFKVADASALPFNDNSFDYSTICLALHDKELDLRLKILAEMKRVTKKGGHIIVTDYSASLPGNFLTYMLKFIELIVGADHHRNFKHYMKNKGLNSLLKNYKVVDKAKCKKDNLALAKIKI